MKLIDHVKLDDFGLRFDIMDHPFIQGGDIDKCVKCRRPEIDHSDNATCEACPNVGPCTLYLGKILLCDSCLEKEKNWQTPDRQAERLTIYRETVVGLTKEIDQQVKSLPNFFNAETISIGELADAINADPTVENKKAILFETIHARYLQFKSALLDIESQRQETMSRIQASYQYLVTLTNQLTEKEREKYRLQDLNYKPNQTVTKTSVKKTTTKFSKADLVAASNEHGIPMPILQTLCVRYNCNVAEAVSRFKESTK